MATLLVVDDSLHVRTSCREELLAAGHRVLLARDGVEALLLLGALRVDAVVLDVHMPRMDGLETLRRLREQDPRLPIVLHTSRNLGELAPEQQALASLCLEKSGDSTALRAAVAGVLEAAFPNTPDRPLPLIDDTTLAVAQADASVMEQT